MEIVQYYFDAFKYRREGLFERRKGEASESRAVEEAVGGRTGKEIEGVREARKATTKEREK